MQGFLEGFDLTGNWSGMFSSSMYRFPILGSLVKGRISLKSDLDVISCRIIFDRRYRRGQSMTGRLCQVGRGFLCYVGSMTIYIEPIHLQSSCIKAKYTVIGKPYDEGIILITRE